MKSWFLLFAGIFACSTSVIFIKSSTMHPAYLAAMRLLIASILLSPIFFHRLRCSTRKVSWQQRLKESGPAGVLLALHFITWNDGARHTLAAHATLIVNMVPVVMPLILWVVLRERLWQMEWVATGISAIGITWLAVHEYHFSREHFWGDVTCFVSMVLFALYLSYGRKNRHEESVLIYMIPVYLIAGLICLSVSLFHWESIVQTPLRDYGMALGLALVPTLIGHTLINLSLRNIRGQIVAVLNLTQFIFAGTMAYLIWGEVPQPTFAVVCICILLACIIGLHSHRNGADLVEEADPRHLKTQSTGAGGEND